MTKKSFSILLCIISIIITFSCGDGGKYKIVGEAPPYLSDNDMVYLITADNGIVLDSATVRDRKFQFEGKIKNSAISSLESGDLAVSFILEKGVINIDLLNPFGATGTKLNEQLSKYLSELSQLSQRVDKDYEDISTNETLSDDRKDLELFTLQENFMMDVNNINEAYFSKNKNNAFGLFVFSVWLDFLSTDKFVEIYNSAGKYIQDNPAIRDIMEAVKNANSFEK